MNSYRKNYKYYLKYSLNMFGIYYGYYMFGIPLI